MSTIYPASQFADRVVSRRIIVAMVMIAVAVGLFGETLANLDRPTRAVVWGGLAFAAYAVGLLFLITDQLGAGLARWNFGPWILVWYAITFGLASVTWSQPQVGPVAQTAVSSVLRALWLIAAGTSVWTLGYIFGPGFPVRRIATRVVDTLARRFAPEVRSPAAPWILYAVGSAARLGSALVTGRFNYLGDPSSAITSATSYGQILAVLNYWAPLGVAAAATQVFRERLHGSRLTLAILVVVELAVSIASGDKENVLITVLAVMIPYSAIRRRLPKKALAVIALIFLVVIIPFNAAYRNIVRSGSITLTPGQAVAAAPRTFSQTVTAHTVLTALPDSVDYLLSRVREVDTPAIILQRTPKQIPFQSSEQLIEAPVLGVVPRAVWPDKPILAAGYAIHQQYYGQPATSFSSSSVTPIGSLYQHGGWIPMLIGMFVFGCAVRLLDDVFDVRANPHAIFFVVLFFPTVVAAEEDWILLVASSPATVLSWLLAVAFTFRTRRLT